jgi:hypothetical protein
MDTNLYWAVRGTYAERKATLASMPREWLEAAILDVEYNDFISSRADDKNGKRVPYIGWYWRHITFSDLTSIPIGDCGEFIGFMANNKWDYPERRLKADEAAHIVSIIDEAMRLNQGGGNVAEIEASTNAKLREMWDYMQTLSV